MHIKSVNEKQNYACIKCYVKSKIQLASFSQSYTHIYGKIFKTYIHQYVSNQFSVFAHQNVMFNVKSEKTLK